MFKIKKGLDIPISGKPSNELTDNPTSNNVGVIASDFVGMKPTMLVKVGDQVSLGQKLIEDKKNSGVFITSPATGIVRNINRGEKRAFISMEIEKNSFSEPIIFNSFIENNDYKSLLLESGYWNLFKTRPFNRTPMVNEEPGSIFINLCDSNPLSINPKNIIDLELESFNKGMEFINNYFSCPIHCCYSDNNIPKDIDNINYHQFTGPHPSGLTGTHINYIQPVSLKNKAWTIGYQEVISLGYLLNNGTLKTHKYISLGGPSVSKPSLLNVQVGGNIDEITAGKVNEDARIISGSVLNGHESEGVMNYLGLFHNQISAIPDEYNDIFLNWLMPGTKLHSKLNVFLSSFIKPESFTFNTATNGANRAIVPVNSYDEIMPMDILVPQFLKALVIADIETSVDLGMLDLIDEDLALCSYVCPSKYDYGSIIMSNLDKIYSEL